MPSRSDFQALSLIEEAAVLCEAAEKDFERLSDDVQKTVRESVRLTEGNLLQLSRARRLASEARARLSEQLQRRDPKSVTTCYCKGRLWVCQKHPAVALDECPCGAASVPCSCNPYRSAPPGYIAESQIWNRPRSIHGRRAKHQELHWHNVSDAIQPDDGEQVLVRALHEAEPVFATFRAVPVARWISTDSVYSFRFFAQWRRI